MSVLLAKDPKLFTRPTEFLPERWSRDRPYGPIHPYSSLPFSHGTRMCIGKRIAEQEIFALIMRVSLRYHVSHDLLNSIHYFLIYVTTTIKTRLIKFNSFLLSLTFNSRALFRVALKSLRQIDVGFLEAPRDSFIDILFYSNCAQLSSEVNHAQYR